MGNPLSSLTLIANQLPKRGYNLKVGEWVTTGAVIGPITVEVRGDFR